MKSQRPPIQIARPSTGEEEWQAVREPLMSGWLTQGPQVAAFERAFAARHEVAHAVATTSCTTALHLALSALGVGPGDEVIVPAFTWIASANAVLYCGATPVLVDVLPGSYNIDPDAVADAVTPRTKAVMPVHLFGLVADMAGLRAVLPAGVHVVEDAACAAGAAYRGVPAGGLGDVGCFSFHPRKSITTGEGGMLTTDDDALAERAVRLRNHGASVPEEARHAGPRPWLLPAFEELGFNYRMTDVQAAIGKVQLSKLDGFVAERERWARWYLDELAAVPWLEGPAVPNECSHAWQAFVTVIAGDAPLERDELMQRLHEAGVSTRPGTHAISRLGYYRERFDLRPGGYPVAEMLHERSLALPLHNRMSAADYHYVVEQLKAIG